MRRLRPRSRRHPLLSLSSTSELSLAPPARHPQMVGAFLEVSFSFAASECRVHFAIGFPSLCMFRPQHFSCSRRFTPPQTLWVYFTPQPRSRFYFRGFPRQSVGLPFSGPSPPVVGAAAPASRVLLRLSIRCMHSKWCLLVPLDPLLHFFFFGLFSEHLDNALALAPLMTFHESTSQSHLVWPSAYLSMFSLSSCPQRVLPVRDFWPAAVFPPSEARPTKR